MNKKEKKEKIVKTPKGPVNNEYYKTRICKRYLENSVCPYNNKCQYAHGEKELEKWTRKKSQNSVKKIKYYYTTDIFKMPVLFDVKILTN